MLQELALDDLDPASAWEELRGLLGEGVGLVSYFGHGSVERWSAPALLTSAKARDLENGSRLPIVLAMTCLNGFFHDVYTESLAEALLRSERGGAAAVWASSSLTDPAGQQRLLDEFLRAAFDGPGATVGEAILRAKAAVSDADVRRTWILFGDPAAHLR